MTMEKTDQPGRCDSCCRISSVLYKVSLGHDFFDRAYNRLSAVDDQAPRWYCEECSREKDFQRDVRSIREEFLRLRSGSDSLLSDPSNFLRARQRIREIDQQIKKGRSPHVILSPRDVAILLMDLDSWADDHGIAG